MAGPVRFELTMGFPTPVFKTGAFNRSATDPLHIQTSFKSGVFNRTATLEEAHSSTKAALN